MSVRHCSRCGVGLRSGLFICPACVHVNTCANGDLKSTDVPTSGEWAEIENLALSFNGYDHWGDQCGAHANEVLKIWAASNELPANLSDLRASLFYEQRRWRHFGEEPAPDAKRYINALLGKIRESAAKND